MKSMLQVLMFSLFVNFFIPANIEALSICQRMHSCPAKDGSYVCGDTGRCSKCPDNPYCQGGKSKKIRIGSQVEPGNVPGTMAHEKGEIKVTTERGKTVVLKNFQTGYWPSGSDKLIPSRSVTVKKGVKIGFMFDFALEDKQDEFQIELKSELPLAKLYIRIKKPIRIIGSFPEQGINAGNVGRLYLELKQGDVKDLAIPGNLTIHLYNDGRNFISREFKLHK